MEKNKKKDYILIKITIVISCLAILAGLYLLFGPEKKIYLACTEDKTICLSEFKTTNNMNYIVSYTVVNTTNKKIDAGILKGYNTDRDDNRQLPFNDIEAKGSYEGSIMTDAESWKDFQTIKKIVLVK